MKVTVMGLGLNGGGLESARYLALHGAECTITDTNDEKNLRPSIEALEAISLPHPPFRFCLGRHEMDDFVNADMVIKNPGVRPDSPYLTAARRIETDISLFLAASPARLSAVTGSKGKSGTASAIHWALAQARKTRLFPGKAFLGGNIAVSPLSFLDELTNDDDVVLELSSWQLGDLKDCGQGDRGQGDCGRGDCGRGDRGRGDRSLLKPRVAVLTSIMADHQDRYGGMEAYVNDKRLIYHGQDKTCATIASADDDWGRSFLAETPGRPLSFSEQPFPGNKAVGDRDEPPAAWIDPASGAGMASLTGEIAEVVPPFPLVPGRHQKKNLLAAALALLDLGLPAPFIRESLGAFPGIEHRLEFFREIDGIRFYNDTAATIPEAAAAAVEALGIGTDTLLILVTGGTDKNLDFSPLVKAAVAAKGIILLAGTGSDRLIPLFREAGLSFQGPYNNIDEAAHTALALALSSVEEKDRKNGNVTAAVVLSPGCASFGMFRNEFDRGKQWKEAVGRINGGELRGTVF
ncbi:MAG: UDP-N-acetylmuramoyl-L-alanine--D-glutamate ligase [Spirochaetaceae bacterium]|jgi:UDP-N-acetylmuramoylalanine--D-glutamate ligase|nr:UDP-N-acetylmuramoyl-L-alanine--D-glutamate ligase [Spirochaetaceae bacterium]